MTEVLTVDSTPVARITARERPSPTPCARIQWLDMSGSESYVSYSRIDPDSAIDCARFEELADRWEVETGHISSPMQKTKHTCFAGMLQMGDDLIPWALERLRTSTVFWYLILERTVSNPPCIDAAGDMNKQRKAWLAWGRKNGYAA